jgi:hypothetical protein
VFVGRHPVKQEIPPREGGKPPALAVGRMSHLMNENADSYEMSVRAPIRSKRKKAEEDGGQVAADEVKEEVSVTQCAKELCMLMCKNERKISLSRAGTLYS